MNALATSWARGIAARPAFADVALAHLDDVYRYLALLTGDSGAAEDLAAQTFEKALRSWRRYDPRRGSELAWLCAIARTTALDEFRAAARRRRREELYARETAAVDDAPLGGFSPALDDALRTLTAAEREVLALRIVLELDAATAAQVLGIARAACSMRLARALAKLEERMTKDAST